MARVLSSFGSLGQVLRRFSPVASPGPGDSPPSTAHSKGSETQSHVDIEELLTRVSSKSSSSRSGPSRSWKATDFPRISPLPSGPLLYPQCAHRHVRNFLHDNPRNRFQELMVETHIIQAKVSWLIRDFASMEESARAALNLSSELSHDKYAAKICLYMAVALFGLKDFDQGQRYLTAVESCRGVFREGELIEWVQAEARIYQGRIGKKSTEASPSKVPEPAKQPRDRSKSITAPNVPGKAWHRNRRNTSASPPPIMESQTGSYAKVMKRRLASGASNGSFEENTEQALGAELGELLEGDEKEEEEEEEEEEARILQAGIS